MKYWILAISLFVLGCNGGESGDSDEASAETAGAEVADELNEALDAAANVENVLEDAKRDVDAAVEDAEEN
jgi:hypothetical protein